MAPNVVVMVVLGISPILSFCELTLQSRKSMPSVKALQTLERSLAAEPISGTDDEKTLLVHEHKTAQSEQFQDDPSLMHPEASAMAGQSAEIAEIAEVPDALPRSEEGHVSSSSNGRPASLVQQVPEADHTWCIADPFTSTALAAVSLLASMAAVAALTWWLAQPTAEPVAAQQGAKRVRMDAVDGLRTLLVTYVIFSHSESVMPEFFRGILGVQHWCMQFFFVLSGFIMTHVSAGKFDAFDGYSASHLFARRLARLAPVYMLALGSMFIECVIGPNSGRPLLAWPLQGLFLQSLLPLPICVVPGQQLWWWGSSYVHMGGNGVGWFTSAVVLLSFAFPLLYNCRPRAQWGVAFCGALLVFVVCLRSVPTIFYEHFQFFNSVGLDLYGFVPLRLLEFLAGMLAACACEAMPTDAAERWRGWGWVFDLSLILAVVMALVLPLPLRGLDSLHPPDDDSSSPPHGDFYLSGVFCVTCIAARCAAEQAAGTGSEAMGGVLGPILASPLLVSMAEYSFSAYILQSAMGNLVPPDWKPYLWPLKPVICWVAGYAAMVYVERPLRKAVELRIRGLPLKDAKLPAEQEIVK